MGKSEQQKFLEDLDIKQDDVLEQPLDGIVPEKEEDEVDGEMKLKTRRERRLMEKVENRGKEVNQLTDEVLRLRTIVESRNVTGGEEAEYLKRIKTIYGEATPEAKEATSILVEALQGLEKTAIEKAVTKLQEERGNESRAVQEEEENLDDMADRVEEEHGIDMSVDVNRRAFFALMEKASPKDKQGDIVEYADPDFVAEQLIASREKGSNRAKELAARSMTRSGSSQPSNLERDAVERYLKSEGVI